MVSNEIIGAGIAILAILQGFGKKDDQLGGGSPPDFFVGSANFVQEERDRLIAPIQKILDEALATRKRTFFQNPNIGESLFESQKRRNLIPRNIRFAAKPKGSIFGLDPFTGKLLPTGIGSRGSQKTIDFFGGAGVLAANRARIDAGSTIANNLNNFINSLKSQINLIKTTDFVSL